MKSYYICIFNENDGNGAAGCQNCFQAWQILGPAQSAKKLKIKN
jgi:hypothetical protein